MSSEMLQRFYLFETVKHLTDLATVKKENNLLA